MTEPSTPLGSLDPEWQAQLNAVMQTRIREQAARLEQLPAHRLEGEAALQRLLPIAQSDTGQASVIARFLLNLYNGDRFPFDMTDFRRLDNELFDDCLAVLQMDAQPLKEVHLYFEDGETLWENMAQQWGFTDHHDTSWR